MTEQPDRDGRTPDNAGGPSPGRKCGGLPKLYTTGVDLVLTRTTVVQSVSYSTPGLVCSMTTCLPTGMVVVRKVGVDAKQNSAAALRVSRAHDVE